MLNWSLDLRLCYFLLFILIISVFIFKILFEIEMWLYYLGTWLFIEYILCSLFNIIIKWNRLVPKFPKHNTKAINIHLGSKVSYFLYLFQSLRSWPNTCHSVIKEDVSILHKIKVFNIWDSYSNFKGSTSYLP